MTYYHGSKADNIEKLKSVVGEFDNIVIERNKDKINKIKNILDSTI